MGKVKGVLGPGVLFAGVLLLACVPAWAQTSPDVLANYVKLDLASKKGDVMTKALLMSASERDVFWPVYDAYQREWTNLNNEREALLKEYIKNANTIDDVKAKEVMAKSFAMQERQLAMLKKYAAELEKKLPAKLVVKFVQVELQMQRLMDLQASVQLPDLR